MLLKNHVKYTNSVLKDIVLPDEKKEQIIIGCTINDLCEFTNEGQPFLSSKRAAYNMIGVKKKAFGDLAIYQSHFGALASMHAMSKKPGEDASVTAGELSLWFAFLNDLALGKRKIDPDKKISRDSVPVKSIFSGCGIEYDQIFDTDSSKKIRYRAIGMMLHLIQDSYTVSHCARNENNELVKFYCYELQHKEKHENHDDVSKPMKKTMLHQCGECVNSVIGGECYDFSQILHLSSKPQKSDGGKF